MKKKRGILAVAILLVVLAAGVVWACSRPEKAVVVNGSVSAQELREIRHAVKTAMRKRVFPAVSWANLKAFPARARRYLRQDVRSIWFYGPNDAEVLVATYSGTNSFPRERYCLVKGTNGWMAYRIVDL